MARKKRDTNEQFVTRMMTYSHYGALSQMFVIAAIEHYANKIADMTNEELDKASGGMIGNFIDPQAWRGVAEEIQERFVDRLK